MSQGATLVRAGAGAHASARGAAPAIKAQSRTYSQSAQRVTLNMKAVGADGKETTVQATYQLDGKTLTVRSKNLNAKGEDTFVFNKQ